MHTIKLDLFVKHLIVLLQYSLLIHQLSCREPDGASEILDHVDGDQGNLWLRWVVDIHQNDINKPFKIILEAMVGDPKNGNIAVDDVVFHKYCRY